MSKKRMLLATLIAASYCTASTAVADERASRYYEDDAWYDVTEWFDGNDYNPTDEAIGRWDDEVFSFADNATSSDEDNDSINNSSGWDDYGYADDTADSDRWFYDYYDDGSRSWRSHSYTIYNDSDDDGVYDSFSYYYDADNDGLFEDYTYYSFDKSGDDNQKAKAAAQSHQKDLASSRQQISGTVDRTKMVNVRGRQHLLAHVKTNDGGALAVDLGPQQDKLQLAQGDTLTATGHRVKVGDQPLLIASEAQAKNADLKIDRNGRKYSGTVASTREVTIQNQQHLLAKVKTDNGKSMLVDLGAKDQLSNAPKEGAKLTVQGVPVKVNDRVVLMARTLQQDGKKTEIQRSRKSSS